jgi:hypothetical protein
MPASELLGGEIKGLGSRIALKSQWLVRIVQISYQLGGLKCKNVYGSCFHPLTRPGALGPNEGFLFADKHDWFSPTLAAV